MAPSICISITADLANYAFRHMAYRHIAELTILAKIASRILFRMNEFAIQPAYFMQTLIKGI